MLVLDHKLVTHLSAMCDKIGKIFSLMSGEEQSMIAAWANKLFHEQQIAASLSFQTATTVHQHTI